MFFQLEGKRLAKEQWWLSRLCCMLLYLEGSWLGNSVGKSQVCLQPKADILLSFLLCSLAMLLWTQWLQTTVQHQFYN